MNCRNSWNIFAAFLSRAYRENDYLLGRLALSEADALHEATRVSLRRRADDRAVDVYEMYWADLSRLGTGGLRALSSLYQLFFHLNTLGKTAIVVSYNLRDLDGSIDNAVQPVAMQFRVGSTGRNYGTREFAKLSRSFPDMAEQLLVASLTPGGPAPSVEAILHAILPYRFVDHTHADAVVTLTNCESAAEALSRVQVEGAAEHR